VLSREFDQSGTVDSEERRVEHCDEVDPLLECLAERSLELAGRADAQRMYG